MDAYQAFKLLHIFGAVLFLGNIIVTAWWKVMADRTENPMIIAFAQRQVVLTDFVFTLTGVIMIAIGGWGAAEVLQIRGGAVWLTAGQVLFVASGIIWLAGLIPLQVRLSAIAKRHALAQSMPEHYWKIQRWWNLLGTLAVLLPVAAVYFMVAKPNWG